MTYAIFLPRKGGGLPDQSDNMTSEQFTITVGRNQAAVFPTRPTNNDEKGLRRLRWRGGCSLDSPEWTSRSVWALLGGILAQLQPPTPANESVTVLRNVRVFNGTTPVSHARPSFYKLNDQLTGPAASGAPELSRLCRA